MNKKIYLYLALALAIVIIIIAYNRIYTFIPSAKNCGPAINLQGQGADTFERGIQCMLSGYKNVYLGDISSIIYERIPEHYASREIQLITLSNGGFILYTQKGKNNAHLLELALKGDFKNDYLMGYLLDYPEEDIRYYYDRNKITTFEQDKANSLKWVKEHTKI